MGETFTAIFTRDAIFDSKLIPVQVAMQKEMLLCSFKPRQTTYSKDSSVKPEPIQLHRSHFSENRFLKNFIIGY